MYQIKQDYHQAMKRFIEKRKQLKREIYIPKQQRELGIPVSNVYI